MSTRLERDRIESLNDGIGRVTEECNPCGAVLLVQTVSEGHYPTGTDELGLYYACDVLSLSGDEAEAASGTTGVLGARIYARNVGGKVPGVGTILVAVAVGDRWAICYNG